jgi:protein-disulfide isomerase-like protein with CxxC motif
VAQPLAPAAAEAPAEAETGDEEVAKFVVEHAAEIAAEEGKSFELVGGVEALEADAAVLETQPAVPAAVAVAVAEPAPEAASAVPDAEIQSRFAAVKSAKTTQLDRRSALQKIQQMSVAERISLAFKGNKEERFILIRDGCKLVSQAVLESPKVSEAEIESFASMKNVQESVLRTISMKHRFMKNYSIVRALVNNPRAPLDLSLALMKHLLVNDLKNLSMNKNVPDTLRKMAYKNYKMKSAPAGSKDE